MLRLNISVPNRTVHTSWFSLVKGITSDPEWLTMSKVTERLSNVSQ